MLNNIKFARLISIVSDFSNTILTVPQIELIEEQVKDIVEPSGDSVIAKGFVRNLVEDMFAAYSKGKKIEAIKAHRALTGYGLKESKDAIEGLIVDCHRNYNADTTYKS